MKEFTTKIADDEGVLHTYSMQRYPSGEGFDLLPIIVKMGGGPLGDLVDSLGGDLSLTAQVDGAALGRALEGLADAIIAQGSSEFLKRLLRYTVRDSEKVPAAFDRIYQGNYGELFDAAIWVLRENYAPFFKRRLAGVWSRLPGLTQPASSD